MRNIEKAAPRCAKGRLKPEIERVRKESIMKQSNRRGRPGLGKGPADREAAMEQHRHALYYKGNGPAVQPPFAINTEEVAAWLRQR